MNEVWAIEEGEYSDYHIVGVFSTEENAQLVYDAIQKDGGYHSYLKIACWPLDPAIDELRQGLLPFTVWMQRDGTTELASAEFYTYTMAEGIQAEGSHIVRDRGRRPPILINNLWARDETQAVKATNELRAQMIANGQW